MKKALLLNLKPINVSTIFVKEMCVDPKFIKESIVKIKIHLGYISYSRRFDISDLAISSHDRRCGTVPPENESRDTRWIVAGASVSI